MSTRTLRVGEALSLLDGIEGEPEALAELASHWELAGHWNANAVWRADDLREHVEQVSDSGHYSADTGLTLPAGWDD